MIPIVADDLVFAWKRLIDPRTAAAYQAFAADVAGGQELLDLTGDRRRRLPTRTSTRLSPTSALLPPIPRRSSSPSPTRQATSSISPRCGEPAPYQQKWIESPNATEAENYVSSGPVQVEVLDPPVRDRPRAGPQLVWRGQADPDRDPLSHRWRPGFGPGLLRGRRARHPQGAAGPGPAHRRGPGTRPAQPGHPGPCLRLLGLRFV